MWLIAGVGAALAGLFLMLRSLMPWLQARRTGVIRTLGARPQRVERATDPERFEALCRNRLSALVPGLAIFLGGAAFALMQVLGVIAAQAG